MAGLARTRAWRPGGRLLPTFEIAEPQAWGFASMTRRATFVGIATQRPLESRRHNRSLRAEQSERAEQDHRSQLISSERDHAASRVVAGPRSLPRLCGFLSSAHRTCACHS